MPVWLDPSGLKGGSLDLLKPALVGGPSVPALPVTASKLAPVGAASPGMPTPVGSVAAQFSAADVEALRRTVAAAATRSGQSVERLLALLRKAQSMQTQAASPSPTRR